MSVQRAYVTYAVGRSGVTVNIATIRVGHLLLTDRFRGLGERWDRFQALDAPETEHVGRVLAGTDDCVRYVIQRMTDQKLRVRGQDMWDKRRAKPGGAGFLG